ncbi:MAG TPA: acyl-CoA dehydrogenase family protein [Acidothermaceae bacterium]|nr:acyl-CoA dehydrogenase family protein [Acidothermaceae bacterium]
MVRHPLVDAARQLATELLEPQAAAVDASVVPRSHLQALGDARLLGVIAPVEAGGAGASLGVFREVSELLAGADAATWFVQAQHHSVVRMLSGSPSSAADLYLPKLASGELIAGIAFSHLRRFPDRPVVASRVEGGWRLDGVAPWYTGWGLNDVAFISGVSDEGEVIFAAVPAREGGGLAVKAALRTVALDAACTVVLSLDGVVVADDDVALRQPLARWLAADTVVANANPAIFGVGASAVGLLHSTGVARDEPATTRAAEIFGTRLAEVREQCYALADTVPASEAIEERLELRAIALELLIGVTSALVAANAGPAMAAGAPAQRKAREALFLLVQAQTGQARTATLDRWSATAAARSWTQA